MAPRIRLLPDELISQIAAGEVVERPASVVKELVENSLDAGARQLRIELEGGGRRRILVADDGRGMGRDDALLAFDRHATSKIAAFEDLERVATLGFRGEALATIAAVSRVTLVTAEAPAEAWRVHIEGGRVRRAEPAARAQGTTLEVASLFYNVPARRKFLKQAATELRRCVEVVQGYCLACPEVAFALHHEGRLLLEAPAVPEGEGAFLQRIAQVFGVPLSQRLVPLPGGGAGGESIGGFVEQRGKGGGRRLFVFVNGRLLRDRGVLATFYNAVREEWPGDSPPSLFLTLQVPPEDLDVNVHPQKAEVRFRDPSFLDRVRQTLREGLRSARGEEPAPLRAAQMAEVAPGWEGLGSRWGAPGEVREAPGGELEGLVRWPGASKLAEVSYAPRASSLVPLSGPEGARRSLRLLGQYKGALLLLETPDGLLLVDQHAAHERVLYEELAASLERELPAVQRLLAPRLLELGPAEGLRLGELAPALGPVGFLLEPLSGHDFALSGVPAALGEEAAVAVLLELAGGSEGADTDPETLRRRTLAALAASGACRAAIKIHRPLPFAEMEALVSRLLACDQPHACPHGRPTMLKMTDADLERRFGRRG